MQPESVETINLSQNNYVQNNENNQDRFESRGNDAQGGRGARYVTFLQDGFIIFNEN